jgi:hypothetical protein
VEKNMGMISNYTRRSAGVLKQYSEDYFLKDNSCHSFIWEIKSHLQPITGYGGVLGTAMSCQPGARENHHRQRA